jgi:hypothetical protein
MLLSYIEQGIWGKKLQHWLYLLVAVPFDVNIDYSAQC